MKIGITGCGGITQQMHVPTLKTLPGVQIEWLSDLNADLGGQLARASGTRFVSSDIPLGDRPQVDVLVLAIPWGARTPIYDALDTLGDARPGLYVEKPIARTVAEHQRILAPYAVWQTATGLQRRSLPQVNCARDLIRTGVFGPLRGATVRFGGLGRILTRGGYMTSLDLAGGGVLMEMGVHYIDTCLFTLDALDARFQGGRMKLFEGFDLHTEMTFDIDLPEAGSLPLDIRVSSLEVVDNGIELHFTHACVRFDIAGRPVLQVRPNEAGNCVFEISAGPEFGPHQPYAIAGHYWRTFLEGYRTQTANYTNASRALLTTQIIEQAYDNAA